MEWYIDVSVSPIGHLLSTFPQPLSCLRFCYHQEQMATVFDPYWQGPLKYMFLAFSYSHTLNVFA